MASAKLDDSSRGREARRSMMGGGRAGWASRDLGGKRRTDGPSFSHLGDVRSRAHVVQTRAGEW